MSYIKEKIFKGADVYLTSPFGPRINPVNGKKEHHDGVDYGTHLKKLPQYAIEDGIVRKVTLNGASYGNQLYVEYPRLKKIFFHAHLDSVSVKEGQAVNSNTIIGYTGTTGMSTGIHLHLGLIPSEDMKKDYSQRRWEDPEKYVYKEPESPKETPTKDGYIILSNDLEQYPIYDMKDQLKGYLKPKKFGGLKYAIAETTNKPNVYLIDTRDFGRVQIKLDVYVE